MFWSHILHALLHAKMSSSPEPPVEPVSSSDVPVGVIVGAVLGASIVVVAAVLIILIILVVIHRRRGSYGSYSINYTVAGN